MAKKEPLNNNELRIQRGTLNDNHSADTRMYRDMLADSDAAYDALKAQARIDRALSELAGGPARSSATLKAREMSAMRNELGDTERQRERFADNVDHALAGIVRKKDADEVITENMSIARQAAMEINQGKFDAELNRQKQYHDLNKKNSVFDQMYKLYTKRLVGKDAFKAMTGIEVKAMPKPKVNKPKKPTIIKAGYEEPKALDGYEVQKGYDPSVQAIVYYQIEKNSYEKMKEKNITAWNSDGSTKTDQQLYLELNVDGYYGADTATQLKLLEEHEGDFKDQFGEIKYDLFYNILDISEHYGDYIDAGLISLNDINNALSDLDEMIRETGIEETQKTITDIYVRLTNEMNNLKKCTDGIEILVPYDETNMTLMSLVEEYKITYTDSYEDRVRKAVGMMPKMFEEKLDEIGADVLEENIKYLKPVVWSMAEVEELLGEYYLIDINERATEGFDQKVQIELEKVQKENTGMSSTDQYILALSKVEESVAVNKMGLFYPDDNDERQRRISEIYKMSNIGFEMADKHGVHIAFSDACAIGAFFSQLDAEQQHRKSTATVSIMLPIDKNPEYIKKRNDTTSDADLGFILNATINQDTGFVEAGDLITNTGFGYEKEDINDIIAYQRFRRAHGMEVEQSEISKLAQAGLFDSIDIIQGTNKGDSIFLTDEAREKIEQEYVQNIAQTRKGQAKDAQLSQYGDYKNASDFNIIVSQFSDNLKIGEGTDENMRQHELVRCLNMMTPASVHVDNEHMTSYQASDDFLNWVQNTDYPPGMFYRYVTAEERDIIRYLYGSDQMDELQNYRSLLEPQLRIREQQTEMEWMQEQIDKEGPWGEILAGINSIGNGLLAPLSYLDTLIHAIAGTEVDVTSYVQQFGQDASTYREMALSNTSGLGRFLGDVVLGIGQNLPMMLTGPAGLVWMGLSAAGIDAAQQNLSGVSAWEATGHASVMGLVEVLTEKLPFDELLDIGKSGVKGFKGWLSKTSRIAGLDMSGEAIATATQNFIDIGISGEDSRYWQRVNGLMSGDKPMTAEQAKATANFELFVFEPTYSAGVGMLSSFGMSGIITGVNKVRSESGAYTQSRSGVDQAMAEHFKKFPIFQELQQLKAAPEALRLKAALEQLKLAAAPETLLLTDGKASKYSSDTGDIAIESAKLADSPYSTMTQVQIEQRVQSSIQANVEANPKGVQKAMIDSLMRLETIEMLMQRQSQNINHQGIDISRVHEAYVNYFFEGGDLQASAQEAVAGIRDVIATGKLKAADVELLTGAVAEIVGDAELAEAYVGQVGTTTGMVSVGNSAALNVDESNSDITEHEVYNSVENPVAIDYNLVKEYIHDIEERTGIKLHKKQIEALKNALRNKEYKKLSPSELSQHRSKFNSVKERLIAQWEEITGQTWPVYEEDVISDRTGEPIRRAGRHYDAHHIIEAGFNGDNAWWNIHPARYPDIHQAGIHGSGSPANQLF